MDPELTDLTSSLFARLEPEDYEGILELESYIGLKILGDSGQSVYNLPSQKKIEEGIMVWSQVSPSQIESYQKCKRSWFFRSVMRIS